MHWVGKEMHHFHEKKYIVIRKAMIPNGYLCQAFKEKLEFLMAKQGEAEEDRVQKNIDGAPNEENVTPNDENREEALGLLTESQNIASDNAAQASNSGIRSVNLSDNPYYMNHKLLDSQGYDLELLHKQLSNLDIASDNAAQASNSGIRSVNRSDNPYYMNHKLLDSQGYVPELLHKQLSNLDIETNSSAMGPMPVLGSGSSYGMPIYSGSGSVPTQQSMGQYVDLNAMGSMDPPCISGANEYPGPESREQESLRRKGKRQQQWSGQQNFTPYQMNQIFAIEAERLKKQPREHQQQMQPQQWQQQQQQELQQPQHHLQPQQTRQQPQQGLQPKQQHNPDRNTYLRTTRRTTMQHIATASIGPPNISGENEFQQQGLLGREQQMQQQQLMKKGFKPYQRNQGISKGMYNPSNMGQSSVLNLNTGQTSELNSTNCMNRPDISGFVTEQIGSVRSGEFFNLLEHFLEHRINLDGFLEGIHQIFAGHPDLIQIITEEANKYRDEV